MWTWHMDRWGWGEGFIALILLIAVIALIVWGINYLNSQSNVSGGTPGGRTPMDIAKERLAKGEITAEEFETIKKNLEH